MEQFVTEYEEKQLDRTSMAMDARQHLDMAEDAEAQVRCERLEKALGGGLLRRCTSTLVMQWRRDHIQIRMIAG
eukprot:4687825-Pleurochrysis_carterae.AAC.2